MKSQLDFNSWGLAPVANMANVYGFCARNGLSFCPSIVTCVSAQDSIRQKNPNKAEIRARPRSVQGICFKTSGSVLLPLLPLRLDLRLKSQPGWAASERAETRTSGAGARPSLNR